MPLTLAGTTVYFNGTPAPVLYTSANQVGVVAPFGLSGDKADVVVTYQGQVSAALTVSVAPSAPGLFTLDGSGRGQAVAVNQDGSINGPDASRRKPAISSPCTPPARAAPTPRPGRLRQLRPRRRSRFRSSPSP